MARNGGAHHHHAADGYTHVEFPAIVKTLESVPLFAGVCAFSASVFAASYFYTRVQISRRK